MPELVLLVPPSEGKAAGGSGRWRVGSGAFGRRLGGARAAVIAALSEPEVASEARLGVRGELLARAQTATASLAAGRASSLPAWQRYTGVVWEHLDPASLAPEQRAQVLVPSALLGLAAGDDPVPDHRLKFSVSLPAVGRLDRWWRPMITDALAARPRGVVIVDLLPNEHRAAIDFDDRALRRRPEIIHVRFIDARGVAVGHDAKAVKGRFARHLLARGLEEALGWSDEGRARVEQQLQRGRTTLDVFLG